MKEELGTFQNLVYLMDGNEDLLIKNKIFSPETTEINIFDREHKSSQSLPTEGGLKEEEKELKEEAEKEEEKVYIKPEEETKEGKENKERFTSKSTPGSNSKQNLEGEERERCKKVEVKPLDLRGYSYEGMKKLLHSQRLENAKSRLQLSQTQKQISTLHTQQTQLSSQIKTLRNHRINVFIIFYYFLIYLFIHLCYNCVLKCF